MGQRPLDRKGRVIGVVHDFDGLKDQLWDFCPDSQGIAEKLVGELGIEISLKQLYHSISYQS